ncbi:MAG TPA: hypothetical protein VGV13_21195 [Methylomirabilota bacterium]|jgi:hypothetical protein|nr:hypothetical protein [Methylomirabilota bacterium]
MTRATIATLAALFLAGTAAVAVARFFGGSGSRGSILASVTAHWLGAYALWTFAGGLALRYGALSVYDSTLFGLLALGMGFWQYRTRVRAGREPALAVFVGGQLAWLAIVGAQNGLFGP